MLNSIFSYFIKSDFIKAQILAYTRHIITALGAGFIVHGFANDSMIQQFSGFICTCISFYLSNVDVKGVDTKIKVALETPLKQTPEEKDQEETRQLNLFHSNIAPGKTL